MGRRGTPIVSGTIFHLVLRGRAPLTLVKDERDWQALGVIAQRMLFWYGGAIHGVRCEAGTMRFAVQLLHASIGVIARYLSSSYAGHVRRRSGVVGNVFRHHVASVIDGDTFLDDLVLWLHRPGKANWTGDAAYLSPGSSWITTERVLRALGNAEYARSTYRRLRLLPTDPAILALFSSTFVARRRSGVQEQPDSPATAQAPSKPRPTLEQIARNVAAYAGIAYEEMRSDSRRRAVTRAKVIVTVLCVRNGISAAAVARFFGRSRSTLVEQAEYYRERQPKLFDEAERHLAQVWGDEPGIAAPIAPRPGPAKR